MDITVDTTAADEQLAALRHYSSRGLTLAAMTAAGIDTARIEATPYAQATRTAEYRALSADGAYKLIFGECLEPDCEDCGGYVTGRYVFDDSEWEFIGAPDWYATLAETLTAVAEWVNAHAEG